MRLQRYHRPRRILRHVPHNLGHLKGGVYPTSVSGLVRARGLTALAYVLPLQMQRHIPAPPRQSSPTVRKSSCQQQQAQKQAKMPRTQKENWLPKWRWIEKRHWQTTRPRRRRQPASRRRWQSSSARHRRKVRHLRTGRLLPHICCAAPGSALCACSERCSPMGLPAHVVSLQALCCRPSARLSHFPQLTCLLPLTRPSPPRSRPVPPSVHRNSD